MFTPRRSAEGDPRSPSGQSARRVTYTISPLGQPISSNIERIESGPVLSVEQIDALYNACYQLYIAVEGAQEESVISERRRDFSRAREALSTRSASGERGREISWLDDVDGDSVRSFPVVSQQGLTGSGGSRSASISIHSMGSGSIYDASVVYESDVERESSAGSHAAELVDFLPEDLERVRLIPIPLFDQQIIWMMRLDEFSDEMILTGMRGFRLHFRRGEDYDRYSTGSEASVDDR